MKWIGCVPSIPPSVTFLVLLTQSRLTRYDFADLTLPPLRSFILFITFCWKMPLTNGSFGSQKFDCVQALQKSIDIDKDHVSGRTDHGKARIRSRFKFLRRFIKAKSRIPQRDDGKEAPNSNGTRPSHTGQILSSIPCSAPRSPSSPKLIAAAAPIPPTDEPPSTQPTVTEAYKHSKGSFVIIASDWPLSEQKPEKGSENTPGLGRSGPSNPIATHNDSSIHGLSEEEQSLSDEDASQISSLHVLCEGFGPSFLPPESREAVQFQRPHSSQNRDLSRPDSGVQSMISFL